MNVEIKASGVIDQLTSGAGTPYARDHYDLFIDGTLVKEANVESRALRGGGICFVVETGSYEIFKQLASYSFLDLPADIYELNLKLDFDWFPSISEVWITYNQESDSHSEEYLEITFIFSPGSWVQPYTIEGYFVVLSNLSKTEGHMTVNVGVFENEGPSRGFYISFPYCSQDLPITTEFESCISTLREMHRLVERSVISRFNRNSVLMYFDFPEEVRIPCEQYLLYFAQFLKDLGVEANTALTHEAGQVLFTITPNDKGQALDKISEALDIYLNLAKSPISDTTNESIAIQRLESNILRLRSDLKLAAAELQAKNATIEAQRLTIDIQKGLLSGEILIDSIKDVTPKLEDKEDFLGGVLSLATYKDKGVEINLAELYRKLKKLFKKED